MSSLRFGGRRYDYEYPGPREEQSRTGPVCVCYLLRTLRTAPDVDLFFIASRTQYKGQPGTDADEFINGILKIARGIEKKNSALTEQYLRLFQCLDGRELLPGEEFDAGPAPR